MSLLLTHPLPGRARRAVFALALLALAGTASAQVVVSQVYGGGGNSGATLRNDFIELKNTTAAAVAVGGWSVQYNSATGTGAWQVTAIPAGTSIPAGGYLLIQQAQGTGGTTSLPTPDVTGTIAMAAGSGKVALVSSSTLLSGSCPTGGALVDFVGYGTANCSEGAPTAVLTNTTAAVRGSDGCTDTNNNASDFSVLAPAPRNSATAAAICTGGGGGGEALAAAIPAIQGSGDTSPLVGQRVVTSGVVTRQTSNGFFIQDLTGDGNPATSDGLFVFSAASGWPAAQLGNLVQVTGTVIEFAPGAGTTATPLTQIASVTSVNLLGTGYTLTPVAVTLPVTSGDSLERFEGMLVRIDGTLTVQQNFFQARFGQLTLGVGRHETPTNRHRPGTPQALALADLQARSRILLDDGSSMQNVNPTPYFLGNGLPRGGDSVSNLVGVLDFGLATASAAGPGLYRLQPTAAPSFIATNPRPASFAGMDADKVKLGAMNVLNYFTTFTNGQTADGQTGQGCSEGGTVTAGNCRGANSLEEFVRQRDKIVRAIAGLDADAVGLMEIQNNGNVAVQNLVDALNAQTRGGPWATVALPAQGTGTDAIRLAVIYKPARLTPVGTPVSDTDPVNNRPTLAQTFQTPAGDRFVLVVNHLKSKGSCPAPGSGPDADQGDGQGCWNATRVQQADRLRTFVAQVQASSGTNDVLLVGDFNAYGQEDPIHLLTSNGYVDQALRFNPFAYSYVFDGTAGRLDYAISSLSMSPKIVGARYWPINADESVAYDYNLEFKQPACAACAPDPANRFDAFRSSDHDPVLVLVDFAATRQPAAVRAAPAGAVTLRPTAGGR
jgi:predicted extracellular nuclease